jgi:hypothetical protein
MTAYGTAEALPSPSPVQASAYLPGMVGIPSGTAEALPAPVTKVASGFYTIGGTQSAATSDWPATGQAFPRGDQRW